MFPNAIQARDIRGATNTPGEYDMDKDRVAGAAKEVGGAVKEAIGKAMGDTKL